MTKKELDIQNAREETGWAYHEMKWLSEGEARRAALKRDTLLQSISGRINSYFKGNKIGPGRLSPGCMTCGLGTWSCLFICSACTANCFFCPQDRKKKKDRPPTESGLLFDNPGDYVDYLERFKFRGMSFSGGEPFLKHKKILAYIRKIRERLGEGIYVWMYTNGDLVDKGKLVALKEAGLNEIRFDIAARNYDLKAVEMSRDIIDRVTVEIPAIPKDYSVLKKCLPRMKAIGVDHLNLHQLMASPYCYRNFMDRRYTFLHQANIPVLESEMTALRIIKHVLDNDIGLSINYCSTIYKNRFQKMGFRKRFESLVREPYEGLTESAFIRRLAFRGSPAETRKLLKAFEESGGHRDLWFFDKEKGELLFHDSLLNLIDLGRHGLSVSYFSPQLMEIHNRKSDTSKEIVLNSKRSIFVQRKCVHETKIDNPVTAKSYQGLFLEKTNADDVMKSFYRNFALQSKSDIQEMMDDRDRLDLLKAWEITGSGLCEIY